MIKDFFETLHTSEGLMDLNEPLQPVPCKGSEEMNKELLKPYSVDEVKKRRFPNVSNKGAWTI